MRRLTAVVALLACLGFAPSLEAHRRPKRYLEKESNANMSAAQKIFAGWVDFRPDDWSLHRYGSREEWGGIDGLNGSFPAVMGAKYLPGRTVTPAKSKDALNLAEQDLYLKLADVWIYVSIHFIDPARKIQVEVAGSAIAK
jgi:hypothetical protein